MKPLIDPIATPDGQFHGKNTQTGELATIFTPKYANDNQAALLSTQREILTILTAAGIKPNEATNDQFLTALKKVFLTTDDTRLNNLLHSDKNLSDVKDKAAARTSLELKGAAVLDVGQKAGTVAAGDDTRITGALQKGNNLSEITAAGVPAQTAARTNLGLKTGAVHDVQPAPTDSTPETLLKMGSFGIGAPIRVDSIAPHTRIQDWCNEQVTGAYFFPNLVPGLASHVIYLFRDTSQDRTWFYFGIHTDTANPGFDIWLRHGDHLTSGIGGK